MNEVRYVNKYLPWKLSEETDFTNPMLTFIKKLDENPDAFKIIQILKCIHQVHSFMNQVLIHEGNACCGHLANERNHRLQVSLQGRARILVKSHIFLILSHNYCSILRLNDRRISIEFGE